MDSDESSSHSATRLGVDLSELLTGVEHADLGTVVRPALERIAGEVDVDIAFAALLADDQIDQVWEWTGPRAERGNPPVPGQSPADAFGPALAFLEVDEPCPIPDLSKIDLGEEGERRFSSIGAEALLLVPVCSHDHLIGVTGFLTVGRTRNWTRRHVETLRSFSRVLVTAALRSRSGASTAAANIRATRIASFIPDGIVTATPDGVITWASPRMADLFGLNPSALVGEPVTTLAPGFETELKDLAGRATHEAQVRDSSIQVTSRERGPRWCEITATLAGEGTADPSAELLLAIRDVHGRRQAFEELEHAASHDSLTGALNRWGLRAAHDATMSAARPLYTVLIDIDHFKEINDQHGHPVGDDVLVDLVDRLHSLAGDDGLVARLGGDEFVFMSTAVLSTSRAESLSAEMRDRLHLPIGTDDHVTVSIGAVYATRPVELSDLLAHADEAVYRAKRSGRDRWELTYLGPSD
ncbi:MAG: sensor domain-containing diguanylate cyclase [Acidimicrobiales bacterium]|nr:sensor domain-containing diguanylate cyclase [Acidimicrobiales bacterium]